MSLHKTNSRFNIHEYTLHKLNISPIDVELGSYATSPYFDPVEYSRFKYGDGTVAKKYAQDLINLLLEEYAISKHERYFLCSSAYYLVPTAANSIADYLYDLFIKKGYSIKKFKIDCKPFNEDYSILNKDRRQTLLSKLCPQIQSITKAEFRDSNILVIDDIKITGLHQTIIQDLLSSLEVDRAIFCYIAFVERTAGQKYCHFEGSLNHYYVNNLSKLYQIIISSNFIPNARICKYILSSPSDDLREFIKRISPIQRRHLAYLMREDGYHKMKEYQIGFRLFVS